MTRCKQCKRKEATKEDDLCDSCRYLNVMDSILKSRDKPDKLDKSDNSQINNESIEIKKLE